MSGSARIIESAHAGPVWLMLLDEIGGRAFLASAELGAGAKLRGWEAGTGAALWTSADDKLINYSGYGLALAHVSAEEAVIAAATDKGVFRWDASTGQLAEDCADLHPCVIWSVAAGVLPDGRAILAGAGQDHRVYRWDAASGELLGEPLAGHANCVKAVAIVRLTSGRQIIVSGDENETWRRWDATTGESVGEPLVGGDARRYAHAVAPVSMAGGRTVLACMNTGGVSRLWDAETGASAGDDLQADFTPLSLASIRLGDTTLLIATSDEGEVVAWNPATGERLRHSLEGLSAAAFRPAHGPAILAVGTRAGNITIQSLEG